MKWRVLLKWLGLACVLAVVVVGGWRGYAYITAEEAAPLQAQATTAVTRGDIAVQISGSGSVEAADKRMVAAGSAGTVAEVFALEGGLVSKGDVLLTLEGADVGTQLESKSIELQRQQMELDQLRESYKTASDEERVKLKLDLDKQQLNIKMVQEELQTLRESQQPDAITAPIDGKITSFAVEPGDTVNAATVVAEIVDYARLQLVVGIDELDISRITLDQTADIRIEALPDETFSGRVAAIADQGSASNGVASFDVTLAIDEPGVIKPGMSAEASILVESKQDVLLLPIDAVQSMGGRYFVLTPAADDGQGGVPGEGLAGGRPAGAPGRGSAAEGAPTGAGTREDVSEAPQSPAVAEQNALPDRSGQRPQFTSEGAAQGQRGNAGAQGGRMSSAAQGARMSSAGGAPVFIEVGLNNEDYIEIVSGLEEGDIVIVPTVATSSGASGQMGGFPGGGFGTTLPGVTGQGGAVFPSGGAGFPSGGGGFSGGAGGGRTP